MESGLYDLSGYDALQLRVRGDGRRFIANLSAPSMGRKDDIWQAFVFTRGGPEWEDITVGFAEPRLLDRRLRNCRVKKAWLAPATRVLADAHMRTLASYPGPRRSKRDTWVRG